MEQSAFTHFQLIETFGLICGLAFNAYTTYKEAQARQVANMIAIDARFGDIWQECYRRPELFRVLNPVVDLKNEPVTDAERLFVKTLIFHLDTVRRASKKGLLVKIEGLNSDVREFFSLPIPKAVWTKTKLLQNQDFAAFVESSLK